MNGFIYGYPELPRAVEIIVGLSEEQFQVIREAVASPEGYEPQLNRCEEIAKRLKAKITARDVFHLLTSLRLLYSQLRRWETQKRDTVSALEEFFLVTDLQDKLGQDPSLAYKRLNELVSKNPVLERRRKLRWLQTGILDNAVDFSSFVDLRPRFTDDRSSFEEFVPVVIFRVVTDVEYGEDRAHVFQLTLDGLGKLRAAVDDIEKKLSGLRRDETILKRLHEGVTKEEEDD